MTSREKEATQPFRLRSGETVTEVEVNAHSVLGKAMASLLDIRGAATYVSIRGKGADGNEFDTDCLLVLERNGTLTPKQMRRSGNGPLDATLKGLPVLPFGTLRLDEKPIVLPPIAVRELLSKIGRAPSLLLALNIKADDIKR